MIISKTPLRISFFGGGTDYPDYIKKFGGAVLSTTIDKYVFITLGRSNGISEHPYKVSYSKLEQCNAIDEIKHPSVRECLRFFKINDGIEVHTISDLPARTGLGSSSSFTVGLLNALYAFNGRIVSKEKLATEAIMVEQKMIGEKVGVQDQFNAAFGGLNFMEFRADGSTLVNPAPLRLERKQELQDSLMLFYTVTQRYAEDVLTEQIQKTKAGSIDQELSGIRKMVDDGMSILASDESLDSFGDLLHQAWTSKRKLSSSISNPGLDIIYDRARKAGAIGGKLLGAGGGGFFLFYVRKQDQDNVRKALHDCPEVNFQFENEGSRIIFLH